VGLYRQRSNLSLMVYQISGENSYLISGKCLLLYSPLMFMFHLWGRLIKFGLNYEMQARRCRCTGVWTL
jgi:hypothetical protein